MFLLMEYNVVIINWWGRSCCYAFDCNYMVRAGHGKVVFFLFFERLQFYNFFHASIWICVEETRRGERELMGEGKEKRERKELDGNGGKRVRVRVS